ncbi:MAG: hypothetical protein AAGE52_20480 [Myxococcota bacterium]
MHRLLALGLVALTSPALAQGPSWLAQATLLDLHASPGASLREGALTIHDGGDRRASFRCTEIARMRRRAPRRTLRAHGARVQLSLGRIRSSTVLIDLTDELCQPFEYETDFRAASARVVSFVGPWVTMEIQRSEAGAGGPPYHNEEWRNVDARTGAAADVLSVVEERSLLDALAADPFVHEHVSDALNGVATLDDARRILSASSDYEGFRQFAFAGYDAEESKTLLRLGFKDPPTGLSPNRVRMLGLSVRVQPRWRRAFEAAARGRGLFYRRE